MQTHPESPGQQSGRAEPRLNFHHSCPAIGGSGGCEGRKERWKGRMLREEGRGGCERRREGENVKGGGEGEMWRLFCTFGFTSFKGCFSWR